MLNLGGDDGLGIMSGAPINLVIKMIKRFLTDIQQFDNSYCRNDHFQKRENQIAVPHYAEVITKKFQKDKKPLAILDFACGHGIPTYQLVQKLLENGVQLQKVVGYDISKQNLSYAQKHNPVKDLIKFEIKNLQTQFDQTEQYDVVVSLFGLHWMNDTKNAIEKINKSLRPGGLFLSLSPLENKQLFEMREKFMYSERWAGQFEKKDFQLHGFHADHKEYQDILNLYFEPTRNEIQEVFRDYTKQKFISFFESWFQEVRHFVHGQKSQLKKDLLSKAYITQFVEHFPKDYQGKYTKIHGHHYSYAHPIYFYQGVKLEKPKTA